MTAETVLAALSNAPKPPTELALEAAHKVLEVALDGYFPFPEIEITSDWGVKITWTAMTSELVFTITPGGDIQYELQHETEVPFGCMSNLRRFRESGDVTDPTEGTQNLLICLLD